MDDDDDDGEWMMLYWLQFRGLFFSGRAMEDAARCW